MKHIVAICLFSGVASCADPDATLTGTVQGVEVSSQSCASYPLQGQLNVGSATQVGLMVVPITCGMPIYIRSTWTSGDIHSFVVGDRVTMWVCEYCSYEKGGRNYPMTQIVIER